MNEDFTVSTGTVMERSPTPLYRRVYAMDLLVAVRKGISSLRLAKEVGIMLKSAWFRLHRLREVCGSTFAKPTGIVEIDDIYASGIEANKCEKKELKAGGGRQDYRAGDARARQRQEGRPPTRIGRLCTGRSKSVS